VGDGEGGKSDGDGDKKGNGKEEGEGKGGKRDGDCKEDGEGGKGDGNGNTEGNSEEEGGGICNSVFCVPKKCVEPTQKKHSHIWAVANHKSQIYNCDTQTQMRYGNAPIVIVRITKDWTNPFDTSADDDNLNVITKLRQCGISSLHHTFLLS